MVCHILSRKSQTFLYLTGMESLQHQRTVVVVETGSLFLRRCRVRACVAKRLDFDNNLTSTGIESAIWHSQCLRLLRSYEFFMELLQWKHLFVCSLWQESPL